MRCGMPSGLWERMHAQGRIRKKRGNMNKIISFFICDEPIAKQFLKNKPITNICLTCVICLLMIGNIWRASGAAWGMIPLLALVLAATVFVYKLLLNFGSDVHLSYNETAGIILPYTAFSAVVTVVFRMAFPLAAVQDVVYILLLVWNTYVFIRLNLLVVNKPKKTFGIVAFIMCVILLLNVVSRFLKW